MLIFDKLMDDINAKIDKLSPPASSFANGVSRLLGRPISQDSSVLQVKKAYFDLVEDEDTQGVIEPDKNVLQRIVSSLSSSFVQTFGIRNSEKGC